MGANTIICSLSYSIILPDRVLDHFLHFIGPGILEHWNTGILEHWKTGTLEKWKSGTVEHLNTGTVEQ